MSNVLITGASSGIGADLARVFATNGHNVILVARREDKLKEVAGPIEERHGVKAHVISHDLSTENAAQELHSKIKELKLEVDTIVNNAGFGDLGLFHELNLKKHRQMCDLNMRTLMELCHIYLNEFAAKKSGRILNVASTGAFQPGPYFTTYVATKAFVLHFSEGLYEEYKNHGITVSCLCPGPTATEFFEAADMTDNKKFHKVPKMTSLEVAQLAYSGLINGKAVIVAGFMNWLMSFSVRFTPRALVRKLTAAIFHP